jgi:hypothetical protein
MLHISLQRLFETYAPAVNSRTYRVTQEMRAEMHVGLYAKCPLLLSYINQNWNKPRKILNIEHFENPFSGSRVTP